MNISLIGSNIDIVLATTSGTLSPAFHILFILGILLATIVFAHTLVRLLLLGNAATLGLATRLISVAKGIAAVSLAAGAGAVGRLRTMAAGLIALGAVAVSATPSPAQIDARATHVARSATLPTITTKGNGMDAIWRQNNAQRMLT